MTLKERHAPSERQVHPAGLLGWRVAPTHPSKSPSGSHQPQPHSRGSLQTCGQVLDHSYAPREPKGACRRAGRHWEPERAPVEELSHRKAQPSWPDGNAGCCDRSPGRSWREPPDCTGNKPGVNRAPRGWTRAPQWGNGAPRWGNPGSTWNKPGVNRAPWYWGPGLCCGGTRAPRGTHQE